MIPDLRDTILDTWRTNNRLTVFLVEHLSQDLWIAAVPGAPRRTVRMIAGHVHNVRCRWIRTLGQEFGIPVPRSVDRRRVGRQGLLQSLHRSSRGMAPSRRLRHTPGVIFLSTQGTFSVISWPTRRTTAARSCSWPGHWATGYQPRSPTACGSGQSERRRRRSDRRRLAGARDRMDCRTPWLKGERGVSAPATAF